MSGGVTPARPAEASGASDAVTPPRARRRRFAAAGLLVLSPVCAEYLIGYSAVIGRPLDLVAGLVFLCPLYGTAAIAIREAVRRTGRGWPAILLLGAAFGVIQAGLVDQSMYNPDFLDDASWDRERSATLVPALGLSAGHALGFVAGHAVWSIAAPIAVVEACVPRIAGRGWLRRRGVIAVGGLWALAVVVFFREHTKDFMASPAQLGWTAGVALALITAAFVVPRREAVRPGRVPGPPAAGGALVIALTAFQLAPASWAGTALKAAALTAAAALPARWSRRAAWTRAHVLAAGGAALVVNAGLSFAVTPIGEVSHAAKYAGNAALMAGVLGLLAWARRRSEADGGAARTRAGRDSDAASA